VPRLYIVACEGGPWPRNTYVEEDSDGMVQAVSTYDEGGRLGLGGYEGLVVPLSSVRPFLIRVQKGGLDEYVRRYDVS
jgi:hypothetical protein